MMSRPPFVLERISDWSMKAIWMRDNGVGVALPDRRAQPNLSCSAGSAAAVLGGSQAPKSFF
jgi:hypothetical protein